MESISIQPFTRPVHGKIRLPGSKSITNRALILAALSRESLTLEEALFSEDTRIMCTALEQLGFKIHADAAGRSLFVVGTAGRIPQARATLHVGNAGTAARFLTAALALHPNGSYQLDGDPAMRKRPVKGLLDALQNHRAVDVSHDGDAGCFPFTLHTRGLGGGTLQVDASASSQILSALMMVAPCAAEPITLELRGATVSRPFIEMTLAMMEQFGCHAGAEKDTYYRFSPLPEGYYFGKPAYVIEPDATAASYFLILPRLTGGSLTLCRSARISLQGDIDFLKVLSLLGAESEADGEDLHMHYPNPAAEGPLEWDFNAISDTFLTLAAVAPLLSGTTTLTGIGHTRHQETDRIAAMATELRRLGQGVEERADSLSITPDREALLRITRSGPVAIHTYHDHRVAMSFAILGSHDLHGTGQAWLRILNPGCCAKTYPGFFQTLHSLNPAAEHIPAPPVFP